MKALDLGPTDDSEEPVTESDPDSEQIGQPARPPPRRPKDQEPEDESFGVFCTFLPIWLTYLKLDSALLAYLDLILPIY